MQTQVRPQSAEEKKGSLHPRWGVGGQRVHRAYTKLGRLKTGGSNNTGLRRTVKTKEKVREGVWSIT